MSRVSWIWTRQLSRKCKMVRLANTLLACYANMTVWQVDRLDDFMHKRGAGTGPKIV